MLQDATTKAIDAGQSASMTLTTVQHEVGIRHPQEIPGVLGIEPICFLIGTRSLSISQEAMARVKQRKQKPALLAHLKSRVAP
jgi:hypothetical protein